MLYRDFWQDDEFARKDGFKDSAELRDFFWPPPGPSVDELGQPFDVIEWSYPLSPPPRGDWRNRFYKRSDDRA